MSDISTPQSSIAVFIDYENLALGTGKRKRNGHQEPGHLPEMKLIMERLVDKGRITAKRAYCDWQRFPNAITPLHELGIETLFVSNAAGGMNPEFQIGDLMVITDHINFFPEHPLRGKNFPTGPRFPDMHEAYNKGLIELANSIAKEKDIRLVHGVYMGVSGPTFETPAEYRAFYRLGADAVGMSTVPEVIVACHSGIKVFGMSIITDLGLEGTAVEVSHEEVQIAANKAQPLMTEIMREMIRRS